MTDDYDEYYAWCYKLQKSVLKTIGSVAKNLKINSVVGCEIRRSVAVSDEVYTASPPPPLGCCCCCWWWWWWWRGLSARRKCVFWWCRYRPMSWALRRGSELLLWVHTNTNTVGSVIQSVSLYARLDARSTYKSGYRETVLQALIQTFSKGVRMPGSNSRSLRAQKGRIERQWSILDFSLRDY